MSENVAFSGDDRACSLEKMCSFKMLKNGVVMGFLANV